jgi:DNA-damage-inducible protein J
MFPVSTKNADARIRIEPELKEMAQRVLADNGLTLSDAVRIFLRQVVLANGLPFDVRTPNRTTTEALQESQELMGKTRFGSAQELFNELEKKHR